MENEKTRQIGNDSLSNDFKMVDGESPEAIEKMKDLKKRGDHERGNEAAD